LNNDTKTKKILIEMYWSNREETEKYEKRILSYDSEELENFNLLNPINNNIQTKTHIDDIETLQNELKEAIEKEEYEKAEELQKKINNILKK